MKSHRRDDPKPAAGVQFGRYVLERRIGRGGMAEVFTARYQATAGVTKRVVVKKILPHHSDDPQFVKMFIAEAKLTASLSHGNLVQVFDFGLVDDTYFLAMEYVEGVTLAKLLGRAEDKGLFVLPAPYAVSLLMEACKGLHYAHGKQDERGKPLGIVHRDVTPENILVSFEGQVKVTDFGVAKAQGAGRSETEPGVVKGKLLYLSPEQARGEKVDARTDVFALGVVLFRMLCGSHPFGGSDLNVMQQIAFGGEASPSSLNPELDPELEQIILKALARDKAARYGSAQALLQALSTWLSRHAPAHPADGLANLMAWLYEPELNALSRPIELPSSFLEMVPLWQQVQVKHGAKSSNAQTRALRSPSKGQPRAEVAEPDTSPRRKTAPLDARPRQRWPLFAGGAALVVAAAVAAFLTLSGPATFTAKIETDPSGATVVIDGVEWNGVTPLSAELKSSAAHHVVVNREGYKPWEGDVKGEAGELRSVWASLTKVQLAPPPVVPPEKVVVVPPPVVAHPFDVDTAPAKFTLLRSRMAVDLKTEKMRTYELPAGDWLFHGEGDLTIDWVVPAPKSPEAPRHEALQARVVSRRLFYAWFQPGKSDTVSVGVIEGSERGGVREAKPTVIPGDARLRLFTLADDGAQSARMTYLVSGVHKKMKTEIGPTIDSIAATFVRPLLRENVARVRALDPDKQYTVSVTAPKGQGDAAVICAVGRGGGVEVPRIQRVDQMQLIKAPGRFSFSEASTAWCAMLDLGPGSAEQVVVQIK